MEKQVKNCINCANYSLDGKCKALNILIKDDCFAWADEGILIKRLNDILRYGQNNAGHYEIDLRNKCSKYYKAKDEIKQLKLKINKKSTSLSTY